MKKISLVAVFSKRLSSLFVSFYPTSVYHGMRVTIVECRSVAASRCHCPSTNISIVDEHFKELTYSETAQQSNLFGRVISLQYK